MTGARTRAGFMPPNYTQTPNTLFDLLPVISNAELRVTLAIVRETFGWQRQRTEKLSVHDLALLAGLSPSSAKTGISEGLKRGTLKRFKAKDEQNRPVYRYALVINDLERVIFEEFERPRKAPVAPVQHGAVPSLPGQNLTTSKFAYMPKAYGQILTTWPVNSYGQNLTTSYKDQRNTLDVKKVVEPQAALDGQNLESERDDDFEKIEPTTPPNSTGPSPDPEAGEGLYPTPENLPFSDNVTESAGKDQNRDAQGLEQVPGAAAPAPAWDPAEVNGELQRLLNRRWLNPWRRKGETEYQPPLIDEPDEGHDRQQVARRISPARLGELVATTRADRDTLVARAKTDQTVLVPVFQTLLLRALTVELARLAELDRQVAEAKRANATPAAVPVPDAPSAPVLDPGERKYEPGARWQHKASGIEVQITDTARVRNRNGEGLQYVLSDDRRVDTLSLMRDFTFLGRFDQPA